MHSCKMLSYMYSVRACLGRQGNSGYQLFIYYPVNSNTDALKEDKARTRCQVISPYLDIFEKVYFIILGGLAYRVP